MKGKVVVLGGTGMLGSMLVSVLSKHKDIKLLATARTEKAKRLYSQRFPNVTWKLFNAMPGDGDLWRELEAINGHPWVINAIGKIKPEINETDHTSIANAVRINSIFPHELSKRALVNNAHVIQIATDCVYSGDRTYGNYKESDAHNALDVYGKTKSLGEIRAERFYNIRCSIIGPEPWRDHKSLLGWVLSNEDGRCINGYVWHHWNGVTTLHFAKMCLGIILNKIQVPNLHHLIPADTVTKDKLLRLIVKAYGRKIDVASTQPEEKKIMTLATENAGMNEALWQAAGYDGPISITQMVKELAAYEYEGAK